MGAMHNPFVPESLEGWSILHLMYRVRWDRLRGASSADLQRMADEVTRAVPVPDAGSTAFVQMLGHKADLMFICFRRGFEQLAQAQLALSRTEIAGALEGAKKRRVPAWLEMDAGNFKATVRTLPSKEEMAIPVQEQLVVALYSK